MIGKRSVNVWLGIDVGGTKTAVLIAEKPPVVLWRREFATQPGRGPEHAIARILELGHEAVKAVGGGPLTAIGVSCGGPLDHVKGVIQAPPNLSTWVDVPIKQILEAEFGVPCHLENDANAGALAEHRYGAGERVEHMVFLTMGTGLGAGLILNGKLFYGASGMAGEIGHVRLTEGGPVGYGKAGSAEGWASGGGMVQFAAAMVREALAAGEVTGLPASAGLTAKEIGIAAQGGDVVGLRIIAATGERLGEAIAVLVDLLNPERIVVGGMAMRLGEMLLGPARARMMEEALPECARVCTIVPATLGEEIGDIAALCAAMR